MADLDYDKMHNNFCWDFLNNRGYNYRYCRNLHRPGNNVIIISCSEIGERLSKVSSELINDDEAISKFVEVENMKLSENVLKYQTKLRHAMVVGKVLTSCHTSPCEVILNTAAKEEVTMIVIGSGSRNSSVGSICNLLIANSRVPVIVCKDPDTYDKSLSDAYSNLIISNSNLPSIRIISKEKVSSSNFEKSNETQQGFSDETSRGIPINTFIEQIPTTGTYLGEHDSEVHTIVDPTLATSPESSATPTLEIHVIESNIADKVLVGNQDGAESTDTNIHTPVISTEISSLASSTSTVGDKQTVDSKHELKKIHHDKDNIVKIQNINIDPHLEHSEYHNHSLETSISEIYNQPTEIGVQPSEICFKTTEIDVQPSELCFEPPETCVQLPEAHAQPSETCDQPVSNSGKS